MKSQLIILYFVLFLNFFSGLSASQYSNQTISVDTEENSLSAPSSQSYKWYRNNVLIDQNTKKIKVNKPGKYTVVTSAEDGTIKTTSVNIGVTAEGKIYTIYLIGDSTVSDYNPVFYPLTGWGQVLQHFFDENVVIENKALGGRSAKSFYNDHWQEIEDVLQPGDYVFIGFGINDAKSEDTNRYSEPFTTFKGYLTNFVDETKAKGAHPVLVSTVRRNSWNITTPPTVYDAWHDYPVATRQLAGEINVPLIDLDKLSVPLYEGLGPDYVGPFMYLVLEPGEYSQYPDGKNDNVHFQEMGAIEMAKLVISAIESLSSDTIVNKLIPHIKPKNSVSLTTNFPDGAIITRNNTFPAGLSITLNAKIDPTYDFLEWKDGSESSVGTNEIYQFTMGSEAVSFTAILDDSPAVDCNGEYNGAAFIDSCGVCVDGLTGIAPCVVLPEDSFKIISVSSGTCIQDNAHIGLADCSNATSQFWILEEENNHYLIKSLSSGDYIYSDKVGREYFLSTDAQSMPWRIEAAGKDTFILIPANNIEYAAEITTGKTQEDDRMRLSTRRDKPSQKFILSKLSPSDCINFPELCISSLSDVSFTDVKVQPNPFSNTTTLVFNNLQSPVQFRLFDLNGREIFRKEILTDQDLVFGSDLLTGVYIAHIVSESSVSSIKIIKK